MSNFAVDFIRTYQPLFNQVLVASLLALTLYLWFRCGLFSLAHIGMMAIGAYTSALASKTLNLPFWLGLILAAAIAVVLGLALGQLLVPRLQFVYLALATLAFTEVVRLTVLNWDSLTRGPLGISGIPGATRLWHLALAVSLVAYTFARLTGDTRFGRALAAIREDPLLAGTLGIHVNRYKALFMAIGAVPAALAGAFKAHLNQFISPEEFGFAQITDVLMMTVLGGRGHWYGAIIGATAVSVVPELMRIGRHFALVLNSLVLMAVVIFLPEGLAGIRLRRRTGAQSPQASRTNAPENTLTVAFNPRYGEGPAHGGPLLAAEGIQVRYGGLQVLNQVSFSVQKGEIFGLIGPNGAGKTTLLNVLTGLAPLEAGKLYWQGQDVTGKRPDQLAALGIARTFQNIRLLKEQTVLENVLNGAHLRLDYGLVGTVIRSGRAQAAERAARAEARDLLHLLGLETFAEARAGSLAYGQQRRVEVARALAARPRMLLLDEPTSGMNEAETEAFGELILKLRSFGLTILLVEHHVPLVFHTCDRVLVLNFGLPIALDSPAAIGQHPDVIEAYLGKGGAGDEAHAIREFAN